MPRPVCMVGKWWCFNRSFAGEQRFDRRRVGEACHEECLLPCSTFLLSVSEALLSFFQCFVVPVSVYCVLSNTNSTPFRSQNTLAITLSAKCICLNFRSLIEEGCRHLHDCCLISGVKRNAHVLQIEYKKSTREELTRCHLWSFINILGSHHAQTFR